MLSKESKIRVLENFYALDYVFFGKNVGRVENCCPLVKEEYLSIKGALLSVFVEMLKLVNHTPEIIDEKVNSEVLLQGARASAKTARKNAQRIVSTNKSRANIKESLKKMIKEDKDLDISAVIESQIRQKAFSLAVDNLLLARVVSESKDFDQLNDWEGTIIEDSYKILRDNLIESAYELLYEDDDKDVPEEEEEDEKKKVAESIITEEPITYNGTKIVRLANKLGNAIEKKHKAGCEKWSVKAPFKGQEYRDKMMACKAAASIKGLQASAAYAKKLSGHCSGRTCKRTILNYLEDVKDGIKDNQTYIK